MMEIRHHEWKVGDEKHVSPFFVWVDGKPRFDLDCTVCGHYRGDDPCEMAVKVGDEGDDKLYPFCGRVCGYFYLPHIASEAIRLTPVAAEDACASASDGDSADRVPAEHDG